MQQLAHESAGDIPRIKGLPAATVVVAGIELGCRILTWLRPDRKRFGAPREAAAFLLPTTGPAPWSARHHQPLLEAPSCGDRRWRTSGAGHEAQHVVPARCRRGNRRRAMRRASSCRSTQQVRASSVRPACRLECRYHLAGFPAQLAPSCGRHGSPGGLA